MLSPVWMAAFSIADLNRRQSNKLADIRLLRKQWLGFLLWEGHLGKREILGSCIVNVGDGRGSLIFMFLALDVGEVGHQEMDQELLRRIKVFCPFRKNAFLQALDFS